MMENITAIGIVKKKERRKKTYYHKITPRFCPYSTNGGNVTKRI